MANDEFDNRLADKQAQEDFIIRPNIIKFLESQKITKFKDGAISIEGYELDYDSLINLLIEFRKDCGL